MELEYEEVETPSNYRKYPDGKGLDDTIRVWRVHDEVEGTNVGLVSDGYGFDDSPDTELIGGGLNSKNVGAVALGRQGNWFLWGFCASPEEMRPSARAVFVNTLAYMAQFAGRVVEHDKVSHARQWAVSYVGLVQPERRAEAFQWMFAPDLLAVYERAPDEFGAYVEQHIGYLRTVEQTLEGGRQVQAFTVDADAAALGLANRDPALLERCVRDLERGENVERARRVLERYTDQTHGTAAAAWRRWLESVTGKLYFSDSFGYRWFVNAGAARELEVGVLDLNAPLSIEAAASDSELRLTVDVRPPWHMYAPGAKEGLPIVVEVLPESSFAAAGPPQVKAGPDGVLEGRVEITVPLRRTGDGDALAVEFTYQVCDPKQCLPPETVRIGQK